MKRFVASLTAAALLAFDATTAAAAQEYAKYSQEALDKELAAIASSA